jgi:3-dehydroquinate synthase
VEGHLSPRRPDALRAAFTIDYGYAVHFTGDALDPGDPTLADEGARAGAARVLPVVDAGVLAAHPELPERLGGYADRHCPSMELAGPPVVLPGGELVKNDPRHVEMVQAAASDRGICRHSTVLVIGGGAVLDVGGYAAATAHRGVRLIRMPTTVLAQSDSGVGVKNGVNAFGKKNFVGSFAPPAAVINDSRLLTTLPTLDWLAGTSEAVKVASLKDADFFAQLEQDQTALLNRDRAAMDRLIRRCARLHVEHIATGGDPFEAGPARPLDFGHWAGHKLEQLSGFRLRHGEAVALGLAVDATYAHHTGLLPGDDCRRVLALLDALGLRTTTPELTDPRLLDGLEEFREHLGGELTITLIKGIGQGVEVHEIDRDVMSRCITAIDEWTRRSARD